MKKICLYTAIFIILSIVFGGCKENSDGENKKDNNKQNISSAFTHSVVLGSKFENSVLGIGAELGDGWRFANDEELAKTNGIEKLSNAILEEILKNKKSFIIDMMAERKFDGGVDSVNLTFLNISAAEASDMTERDCAISTIKGANNATAVIENIKIGTKEHSSIRLVGKSEGKDYYQRMIFIKKNGYMGMLTITCISEDEVKGILERIFEV